MKKQTIRDVLMNLSCGGTDCDGCCRIKNGCPIPESIASIDTIFKECVGENLTDEVKTDFAAGYNAGYNKRGAEIRKRWGKP